MQQKAMSDAESELIEKNYCFIIYCKTTCCKIMMKLKSVGQADPDNLFQLYFRAFREEQVAHLLT
jgi:hypothetical protein